MWKVSKILLMAMVVGTFAVSVAVAGDEGSSEAMKSAKKKVASQAKLPQAVLLTLKAAYPKAEVVGFEKEVKEDKELYEVETRQGEDEIDIVFTADGALVQTEQEIDVKALPEVVVKAVMEAHKGCEIDEAEKITRGETVEYELVIEVDDAEYELLVSSDGEIKSTKALEDEDDASEDEDAASDDADEDKEEDEDDDNDEEEDD